MECRLRLSSLGNAGTRAAYGEELRTYLRSREGELSDEVRARIDANPLRAFDSDHEGTRAVMADAPLLVDRLDPDDAEHFAEVRAFLDDAEQEYELDPTLVRGLDYYTRTVFEFDSPSLGAQSGVGGGGRYDGLVEQLGGPPTPGVGWAAGIERILLAGQRRARSWRCRWPTWRWPTPTSGGPRSGSPRRCAAAACRPRWSRPGRSMKGQLKQADRIGATHVVVVGERDRAQGHGQRRPEPGGRHPGARWRGWRCDRHVLQPLPRHAGAAWPRPSRWAPSCAWPAGCTAAATTAG